MSERIELTPRRVKGAVAALIAIVASNGLFAASHLEDKATAKEAVMVEVGAPALEQQLGAVAVGEPLPQPEAVAEPEPAPKPVEPASATYPVGCEIYEPIVAQYPWPLESAMLAMSKESGCDPNKVSATDDHGLFQLHEMPVYDPAENVRLAYEKYENARRGSHNFSAWYAVCTPGENPQPKYEGINCQ